MPKPITIPSQGDAAPDPFAAPQRRPEKSEAGEAGGGIGGLIVELRVVVVCPETLGQVITVIHDKHRLLVFVVSPSGHQNRSGHAGWHLDPPSQLREAASRGVGRIRIGHENAGDVAVAAAALAATRAIWSAVADPAETPSTVASVTYRVADPGSPTVHDGDDDGQRGIRPVHVVVIDDGRPQMTSIVSTMAR